MKEVAKQFTIQSYIDKNRENLDESLVSLRIMKEVDKFLEYENLSNKELAKKLGYSESYISQLMTGMKNVNVSFILKFEKSFNTKFDFKIFLKGKNRFLHTLDERTNFNLNVLIFVHAEQSKKISYSQNSKSYLSSNVSEVEELALFNYEK